VENLEKNEEAEADVKWDCSVECRTPAYSLKKVDE